MGLDVYVGPLTRYYSTPKLWLAVTMDGTIQTTGPAGNELTILSIDGLWAELEQVNGNTVRLDQHAIDAARDSGPPEDGAFDQLARFGRAIFLTLARIAKEPSQPMILDY